MTGKLAAQIAVEGSASAISAQDKATPCEHLVRVTLDCDEAIVLGATLVIGRHMPLLLAAVLQSHERPGCMQGCGFETERHRPLDQRRLRGRANRLQALAVSSNLTSLHRVAISKRRRNDAAEVSSIVSGHAALTPPSALARCKRSSCILFSVSVPVLSKQITCREPRPSTASRRRTMTPFRRRSRRPSASVVVAVAGKPSGTAATASASALLNMLSHVRPRRYAHNKEDAAGGK